MPEITRDRALGALWGLALGDALGMPTQDFSRAEIVARFADVVPGLLPAPEDQPIAPGMPAGSVTDDTEQALLVGRWLVDHHDHGADQRQLAQRLIDWQDQMRDRGSLDLLGPSTNRALAALIAGEDVSQTGRFGTTNGAAMRVTPAGIAAAGGDVIAEVTLISAPTHNTPVALSGAVAVAVTVSSGLDEATLPESFTRAVDAARAFGDDGVSARIQTALGLIGTHPLDEVLEQVGTSLKTEESVPAAFAIAAAHADDPWTAVRAAASAGGDCDTIAAMVGAMLGAHSGMAAWPADAVALLAEVNDLPIEQLVDDLLVVRRSRANPLLDQQQPPTRAAINPYSAGDKPLFGGRVLSTGTVVVDLVMTVERLPESGTDQVAGSSHLSPGGNFNVLAAAARVGAGVTYLGPIGSGPMGAMLREQLAAEGVTIQGQPIGDNGLVVTLVEPSGERSFVTSPEAVSTAFELADGVAVTARDLVYVSGYELLAPQPWAGMHPVVSVGTVVFDPGPLVGEIEAELLADVLAHTTWLTCNERESQLLTGIDHPTAGAEELRRRHPHLGVVLRLGPAGAVLVDGSGTTAIPSISVDVVDSNGAGDTHTGVFMAGLLEDRSPAAAVRRANVAAAISVTRPGPATCPDRAELDHVSEQLDHVSQ